jgi:hypothetical protein
MQFVTLLAWIFGVCATLVLGIRIYLAVTYSKLDSLRDAINGVSRSFPIFFPAVASVVCWAWIITIWH